MDSPLSHNLGSAVMGTENIETHVECPHICLDAVRAPSFRKWAVDKDQGQYVLYRADRGSAIIYYQVLAGISDISKYYPEQFRCEQGGSIRLPRHPLLQNV